MSKSKGRGGMKNGSFGSYEQWWCALHVSVEEADPAILQKWRQQQRNKVSKSTHILGSASTVDFFSGSTCQRM